MKSQIRGGQIKRKGGRVLKGNLVTVAKMGKLINVCEDDLSKDDTVLFQAGDLIPADIRLVEAAGLEVDEFELTGELMPVMKTVGGSDGDVMLYRGSRVLKGSGMGIVAATGEDTEYGEILKQSLEQKKRPEFRIIYKKHLVLAGFLLPPLAISLYRYENPSFICMVYALVAACIVLMQNDELFKYIILSDEIKKLEEQNIEVLDWNALDVMNDIDTVCFDKTGVLTSRDIRVKRIYSGGRVFDADSVSMDKRTTGLVEIACALCNDVLIPEKIDQANPIDKALIAFARDRGVDYGETILQYKRIYEKPFDSENRYMACGYRKMDGGMHHFIKGDLEVVLKKCKSYVDASGRERKIDGGFYADILADKDSINTGGNIMNAMAYCLDEAGDPPERYIFLCLLELENPLAPGVRGMIEEFGKRGIRSIMLTGDRQEIASKIGEKTGIAESANIYITGKMIQRMPLSEVARQSDYCSVFARLLPSQKGVVIRLLQQKGHRVAMVGDGPNDGVALKVAEIGISFVENSSPIARRLSKILINNVDELLILVELSKKIKRRIRYFKIIRMLIMALAITGTYIQAVR